MGVARQWCGRLGKIENCQVGIYMAYVSRKEHAIVNMRLYLPEEWTQGSCAVQSGRGSQGDQVPHPPRTGVGDAGRARFAVAAHLGGGRRRDGPPREFSPGIAGPGRTVSVGGPLEHIGPRHRSGAARILGTRHDIPRIRSCAWIVGARSAGVRLDDDRGPRRREGAADGGGREVPGAGADADGRHGSGGGAVHHAGASSGRHVQA